MFTTIYEQNSFEPVERLVWLKYELLKAANDGIKNAKRESWEDEPKLIPNMQVFHYHNDQLGTPNELTRQDGEVVWLADYEAWGNTAKVVWREERLEQLQVSADELQPIRFQGQSFDVETGLHYNRFRYFDPDLGMFISRDPIGLMGGSNVFQYAPNPTGWIDPFGLAKTKKDCCKDACEEEKVTVYHYTDEKGYKAISSQSPYIFKTAQPGTIHPKGVYLSPWSPSKILHKKGGFKSYLGITSAKSEYYFEFKMDKCKLKQLKGRPAVQYAADNIIVPRTDVLNHGKTPK